MLRRGGGGGHGPQGWPQRRLGRRLEEVAKAVGGGYCRLQMPFTQALAVRETVAGHRLGAVEGAWVGGKAGLCFAVQKRGETPPPPEENFPARDQQLQCLLPLAPPVQRCANPLPMRQPLGHAVSSCVFRGDPPEPTRKQQRASGFREVALLK